MGSSPYPWQLVGVLAIVGIVLICRWVFSAPSRPAALVPPGEEDLGLLVPLTQVKTRDDAEMLRTLLAEAGVRAGVSEDVEGMRLLVFAKDLDLARQLVSP